MTALAIVRYDPLKDVRHLECRAAPDLAHWLEHLKAEEKADRTLSDYLYTLAAFTAVVDKAVSEYTPPDITHYLAAKPARSRHVVRAHLNSFFRWAYLQEKIDRNPMDRVARPRAKGQTVVDVFSDAEIALMRSNPLLSLMNETGLRKSECRHLKRKHVSLDRQGWWR